MDYFARLLKLAAEQAPQVESKPELKPLPSPSPPSSNPRISKRKKRYPNPRCRSLYMMPHAHRPGLITLQCIKVRGHKAGCAYENPDSEYEPPKTPLSRTEESSAQRTKGYATKQPNTSEQENTHGKDTEERWLDVLRIF